jgi:nucleotide-binding universal stress UspA family protein
MPRLEEAMSIKSVLAPITGYEKSDGALITGLRQARRLGAFVDVLHVKPDPRDAVAMVIDGGAGLAVASIMELVEREGEARAAAAQRLFEGACKAAEVAASGANAGARFTTVVGRSPDEVAVRGRVSDLVVMGRVPDESNIDWRMTLEAALMESGRPILLLPAKRHEAIGKSVAMGWNGGVEAAHAATAALPFLAQAERVLILSSADRVPVEPPVEALAEWLGRHAIRAEQKHVALGSWPVGEELVSEAASVGADFVVMGGYGHSRLRETIFGGATRAVLNESKLPVLLAH